MPWKNYTRQLRKSQLFIPPFRSVIVKIPRHLVQYPTIIRAVRIGPSDRRQIAHVRSRVMSKVEVHQISHIHEAVVRHKSVAKVSSKRTTKMRGKGRQVRSRLIGRRPDRAEPWVWYLWCPNFSRTSPLSAILGEPSGCPQPIRAYR